MLSYRPLYAKQTFLINFVPNFKEAKTSLFIIRYHRKGKLNYNLNVSKILSSYSKRNY